MKNNNSKFLDQMLVAAQLLGKTGHAAVKDLRDNIEAKHPEYAQTLKNITQAADAAVDDCGTKLVEFMKNMRTAKDSEESDIAKANLGDLLNVILAENGNDIDEDELKKSYERLATLSDDDEDCDCENCPIRDHCESDKNTFKKFDNKDARKATVVKVPGAINDALHKMKMHSLYASGEPVLYKVNTKTIEDMAAPLAPFNPSDDGIMIDRAMADALDHIAKTYDLDTIKLVAIGGLTPVDSLHEIEVQRPEQYKDSKPDASSAEEYIDSLKLKLAAAFGVPGQFFEAHTEAYDILADQTKGYITTHFLGDTDPEEMYEDMADNAACVLVDRLLEGRYNIAQYIEVANHLSVMLDDIFDL